MIQERNGSCKSLKNEQITMNLRSTVLLIIMINFLSCSDAQSPTPKKYRNYTIVEKGIYKRYAKILSDSLKSLIKFKAEPYYQFENDSTTQIFIDTILYSPKIDKFAFFAITKNSNDKLLEKGSKDKFHYDAHCFIGILNDNKKIANITWVRGHSLSNYKSYYEASKRVKEIYFL